MENTMSEAIKVGRYVVKILEKNERIAQMSASEIEMDKRARAAVHAAIRKAEVCKHPVAKYNQKQRKAYIELANGDIQDVK